MANSWFRLWTDMVNDPKWRTIARASGQKIGDVVTTYLHMLTLAANATERGRTQGFADEDIATALDIDLIQVTSIREAMQGRVLDGDYLLGWEKRQPLREDGSSERGKQHRELEKLRAEVERFKKEAETNATERNRTQPNARGEEIREDKSKPKDLTNPDGLVVGSDADDEHSNCPHKEIVAIYHEVLPQCPRIRDWTPARAKQLRARWNEDESRQSLDYWKRYFEYVATCDFLVGKVEGSGRRPFFADLEWLTKAANFAKVRERRYEQ